MPTAVTSIAREHVEAFIEDQLTRWTWWLHCAMSSPRRVTSTRPADPTTTSIFSRTSESSSLAWGSCSRAVALVAVGRLNFRRLVRGPTAELFSTGVFSTLVVLWLLGINRGEVTRLWIFLAMFVSMVAAYGCSSRPEVPLVDLVLAASITHIAIVLHMVAFPDPWTPGAGPEPLHATDAGAGGPPLPSPLGCWPCAGFTGIELMARSGDEPARPRSTESLARRQWGCVQGVVGPPAGRTHEHRDRQPHVAHPDQLRIDRRR